MHTACAWFRMQTTLAKCRNPSTARQGNAKLHDCTLLGLRSAGAWRGHERALAVLRGVGGEFLEKKAARRRFLVESDGFVSHFGLFLIRNRPCDQ